MVSRTRPNPEALRRAAEHAEATRVALGLPAEAEGNAEYEASQAEKKAAKGKKRKGTKK